MKAKKDDKKKAGKKTGEPLIKSPNIFPVVGIGASAGGLDAFKKLLKAIPEDSGMAYVLVQHLDPKHESMLPELLQKVTKIPVMEIADDIKVEPNHIYVIPSNKMMVATDGVLLLAPRPAKNKNERNLPIDLFFTSLAEVHQAHSIGVVLSGTASDGTLGLKAIKDHGGITFAQDEESAAYEGMPHSAAQAGVVDFILPPEKIPQKLLEITGIINGNGADEPNIPQQDEELFKQILSLLRIRKGTDFTYYKQSTIRRRILRRMVLNKNEEPAAYLKYLRENKTEQDVLYQDLLIPVTSFFRDQKTFDNLYETVFPLLVKNKTANEPIRIWVAGCSTGEEAYSIAICLKEFLGEDHHTVQIFATDLSEPAIAKARYGVYTKSELNTVTPQRLQEFFTKTNGSYQVNKNIRDLCVFAHHNFLKDPPFGKMDFISCRNVLIYMEPYLQKKALTTFHYSLNPKGFLLLGKSETTSGVPDLFVTAAKNDKLFSRKDVPGKFMHVASQRSEQNFSHTDANPNNEIIRTDFQKTADDIMLRKYTPAGVVVNEAMDIVHFRGNTGSYLEQSPGKPSHNLLQMAKSGLGFELRNILHKAKKDKAAVIKENIPMDLNGSLHNISIEAIPLPNIIEPHYLILFHDSDSIGNKQPALSGSRSVSNKKATTGKTKKDDRELRILQLEKELSQAREDMRSITEDQEAANEELQSANEELLSSSEELQSLNEELETGKEELQSTNEELMVVNQEMIGLNEQLTLSRDYSEAIIINIHEPLLVLDKNLRIKTANNAFYKIFRVTEQETEGNLIYNLGNKQWDIPELRTLLEKILPEKSVFNDFKVTHNFSSIGERVMRLNAREVINKNSTEKLILLSIEDITEREKAQEIITKSNEHFRLLVKELPAAVYSCDAEGYLTFYNDAAVKLWGRNPEIGKDMWSGAFKMFNTDGSALVLAKSPMARAVKESRAITGEEIIIERPDGSRSTVLPHPQPEFGLLGEVNGAINILFDITELAVARKKLEVQAIMVEEMLLTAPAFIATLSGPDHVYELVNERYQQLFGKRKIQGKPIIVALPELEGQGFVELLDNVYNTGKPFIGIDIPLTLARDEDMPPELRYFNFSYQAIYDEHKTIYSILVFGYEVTDQVIAKNKNLEDHQLREKDLEEKVQERTLELNEANKTLLQRNQEIEEAREKLMSEYSRSLIEASLDPLVTINPEGKITDMNQATVLITGIKREKLTGSNFFEYFTESQKAREVYEEVFAKGSVANSPLTLRNIDGTLTDVFLNGSVYKDAKANVLGVVLVARDVTEQKKAALELTEAIVFAEMATVIAEDAKEKAEKATQLAEDAAKARQQFLSNMSHEIRTPMNAIIGFTKVVLKTDLTAKQKEYLTAIKMSGNSLIVLINDILDLAKVDAGKMTFEEIPFKISSSVSSMIHLFETKVQEKNLELIKEYDPAIPETLLGDPVRLHQIILNLVSNAIKFTSKGKITVNVRLLNEDDEKVTVEFAVSDTGIGIPENKMNKVFENFHQAASDTSRLYGGTGLGLAIVKQLVESQGGTIQVKSKVNEGSVFSFTLDFKKTNAQAEIETEFLTIDSENKNIKVLVVEDIALNQLLMKTLLDDFGFERDIAANGKIAIEKLATEAYDIILMDLQMPEMNGFEATEYIRNKMNSQIPIIALTADVTTVDLEKCRAVGMNDYIAKPVDERLLYSKIVGLVKKPTELTDKHPNEIEPARDKKSKCIDLAYLSGITKHDSKLMMEMIALYLEQTPPLINAMKKSLHDEDWHSLRAAAHKLIPSFSIMGIHKDFEIMTKKVQEYTGATEQAGMITDLVIQLDKVCTQACIELEEEYTILKNTIA